MQKFTILLHDDAIEDLKNALSYYRNISPSLEEHFYNQVNLTLNALMRNPFYQIRYDNFRMKIIKKFPYVLHFIVDEKKAIVYIFGIRNTFQNPHTSYIKT